MRIQDYSFGRIIIDGQTYTKDVIILPERVYHPWWRKEGHRLSMEDLVEALSAEPEMLIIGRGYAGVMRVPDEVVMALQERGIEVVVQKTRDAVKTFNDIEDKRTVAALHLTC